MTRRILASALTLATMAALLPSIFAGQLEDAEPEINFYAMQRTRYESFNNYLDADDDDHDRLDFWATRTLVGMKTMLARDVWSQVEIQHIGTLGNQFPERSLTTSFGIPILQNVDPNLGLYVDQENNIQLYRAIVGMNDIGGSGLGLALGRQEFTVGGNLVFGNEPFYNGTVFDGLTGWYKWTPLTLRGSYFITQERSDPATRQFGNTAGNEDQRVWGFDATIPLGDGEGNNWGDVAGYVFMMDDGQRDPAAKLEETVYGAQWGRDAYTVDAVKANPMTWSIEIAIQDGEELTNPGDPNDGDTDDFSGWIAEGFFGWNFLSHDRIIHRPAVGFITVAGDDDLTDEDFTGFSPWFGDAHCRIGCTDFFTVGFNGFDAGITATWAGYTIMTNPGRHKAFVKYWQFVPTEDSVRVSSGSGGTVDIEDYGTEIDVGYSYGYSENARLFFTYANFSPDEGLVGSNNPDDSIERIYGGLNLKFK